MLRVITQKIVVLNEAFFSLSQTFWLGHFQAGSQGRLCRYKVRLSRISPYQVFFLKPDLFLFFSVIARRIFPVKPGDHSPARLKELVQDSVTALNGVKIRTLYLHKPDRSVPFGETVSAIDELHKQGILCVPPSIIWCGIGLKKGRIE
jgi:hypothetical protein